MNAEIRYMMQLKERLEALQLPIFFDMPERTFYDDFVLIGTTTSNTQPSAKLGRVVLDYTVHVDMYVSAHRGREYAMTLIGKAIRLIGQSRGVSTQLVVDDSLGRELFHVSIRVNELIS